MRYLTIDGRFEGLNAVHYQLYNGSMNCEYAEAVLNRVIKMELDYGVGVRLAQGMPFNRAIQCAWANIRETACSLDKFGANDKGALGVYEDILSEWCDKRHGVLVLR